MADRSRMNREVHVRICGGLEVKFLRSTRLQSGTHSVFLEYYLHICNHILCSFPRQLFFGKLYIRYAQPTLWLNCVNRLSGKHFKGLIFLH